MLTAPGQPTRPLLPVRQFQVSRVALAAKTRTSASSFLCCSALCLQFIVFFLLEGSEDTSVQPERRTPRTRGPIITSDILSDRDEALGSAVQSGFRRIRSWRVPPNWSRGDWFEELAAIGTAAAWNAVCEFDPERGVPLAGFGYCRMMTRCLSRYRKEWRYALHIDASNSPEKESTTFERPELNASFSAKLNETHPSNDDLRGAIGTLPAEQPTAAPRLFWEERTRNRSGRGDGYQPIHHQSPQADDSEWPSHEVARPERISNIFCIKILFAAIQLIGSVGNWIAVNAVKRREIRERQGSLAQLEVMALRIRRNVGGRSAVEKVKSLAALILFCCMSMTMLFAQAPSAPAQPDSTAAKFPAASGYANTKLTHKIIDAPKHTYGYDVFADGRLMIHQTSAPALPGNEGFKTREEATKVALLVIKKIKKGEMPPTISIDEMKKLGVVK